MAAKKKARRLMLAIPEDVVTSLIDPAHVFPPDDEVADAARCAVDEAASEIAAALADTGRPLAHLHVLRAAAEVVGFRSGYAAGAVATGWIVHALARDIGNRKRARS